MGSPVGLRLLLPALAAGYGLALVVFRPASPFEWDEVLFLKALERFDVARHEPHPPGYPLYVLAGRIAAYLQPDGVRALQAVAIAAALVALAALWVLATRLGATPGAATLSCALLAAVPAFAFNANVGLSDVPGGAAALLAALVALRAWNEPQWLPLAAAALALATGVRPQVLPLLAPFAAAAAFRAARRGHRGALLHAVLLGGIASALVWAPVVLLTGPRRYWAALGMGKGVGVAAPDHLRLAGASARALWEGWLVRPFGSGGLAALFWALVALGAWCWWRTGHRALVGFAGLAPLAYLLVAVYGLDVSVSVRYVIPTLPFLALLACGVVEARPWALRATGVAAAVTWVALAVAWAAPVYDLRRLGPSPTWEALSWIRDTFDPSRTTVVVEGAFLPHAEYLLQRRGFRVGTPVEGLEDDGTSRALRVVETPHAHATVLFARSWPLKRLRRLTQDRYHVCYVTGAIP